MFSRSPPVRHKCRFQLRALLGELLAFKSNDGHRRRNPPLCIPVLLTPPHKGDVYFAEHQKNGGGPWRVTSSKWVHCAARDKGIVCVVKGGGMNSHSDLLRNVCNK
ncbi:hypothetical protein CEXT_5881 [Caerostris extrusa]|uniref:Uncharacterized protein n=1 Tax=Caerostris extrusa TaxID=172846 RepID=A0AAV4SRY6_CAEEX|nr:hypothetical protein CEXT_5881 [Caerostris extrusa]